jgi:hypothetical protein
MAIATPARKLRALIEARSATAKDTASVLGVSKSRLKELVTLTRSALKDKSGYSDASRKTKDQKNPWVQFKAHLKAGANRSRPKSTKKPAVSRKGHDRGKGVKTSR